MSSLGECYPFPIWAGVRTVEHNKRSWWLEGSPHRAGRSFAEPRSGERPDKEKGTKQWQ